MNAAQRSSAPDSKLEGPATHGQGRRAVERAGAALPDWRRWWPRKLRHQMLMLLGLIVTGAMAVLFAITTWRTEAVAAASSRDWALAVSRSAASAGAEPLAAADFHTLETVLRDIAALPGVLRIDTFDANAAPLLSLSAGEGGRVVARWRRFEHDAPTPDKRSGVRAVGVAGQPALQAWSPLGPAGGLGVVAVTFTLDRDRAYIQRLRYDAVLAIGGTGLLLMVAAQLLLRRSLAPLNPLLDFSRRLATQPGISLANPDASLELDELTQALNEASQALRTQWTALRESEDRLTTIVNSVPDGLIGFDPDGRIAVASPAVASIFGHEPGALRGTPVSQLLTELDGSRAESLTLDGQFVASRGTHVTRFETQAARQDGTQFPAEVSLARVASETGVRFACVVRDITDRRLREEMLALYGRALECTHNGIVISDMGMPGQPVFYANAAFERITGYAADEVIGRNCKFLQGDDDQQPEIEEVREAVQAGISTSVVLRNYRKDGSLFFNELSVAPVTGAQGTVRHYVGVLHDVTERERSRMALAERGARLNAVFDMSPDGFVVFDRQGRLVVCNQAFHAMTGWPADDDLAGLTLETFDQRLCAALDPAQPVRPLADAVRASSSEASPAPDLMTLVRPQQRVLARVVRSGQREHDETILFFRDITRETEVDRMKSEFLTTAAHELRTPMVSVFGFTELLLNRTVSDERRRDVLQTIHRQASLLINMVNELLDLARIEARQGKDLQFSRCRISDLMRLARDAMAGGGRAASIELEAEAVDTWITADTDKLLRALTNVLSNAIKYSPDGGLVAMGCVDGALDGRPAVGLWVSDQGIGMSAEQVRRVFERFYRADPSGNIPGTGLGMSLVKEIIELHRGRVDVHSEPGRGTRVTLWLPATDAQDSATAGS